MSAPTRAALDSKRFGVEVFRSLVEDEDDANAAIECDADLVITRVRTHDVQLVQRLEGAGFFLTDTLVYFRGETTSFTAPGSVEGLELCNVAAKERAQLEQVSRSAFADFFGHYHTDPRIDAAVATEGYVEWSCSALDWTDGFVLGAFDGDVLAGFATVKLEDDAGEIVLNGVAPAYQRRGIYGALVRTIGHRLRARGTSRIFSSTQIQNLGPQKTWARAGLLPAESWYTFHRWP
ncbi:MAG: GNAT family N-acetyltransferase [Deltaproteobacteria bacterium]